MKSLISMLIVVTMGLNLINFEEPPIDPIPQPEVESNQSTQIPFEDMSLEQRAIAVNLTTQEYIAISNIVERESDRSIPQTDEDLQGRIMLALVVFNRVSEDHPEFGNDVISVITQPGQFSTSRRSRDVNESTYRTEYSDRAVYEAYLWIHSGEEYPDVLYFNCISFFRWRPQYQLIGGNYFSL